MATRRYFPLFIDLTDRKVVIVGSGKGAEKKVKTMIQFTKNVTLVTQELSEELNTLAMSGHIQAHVRAVKKSDFNGAFLVLAASPDRRLNDAVCRFCHEQGIYVCVQGNDEDSDFFFPGVCTDDEIVIGVSTTAEDHHKARVVRTAIQKLLEAFPD